MGLAVLGLVAGLLGSAGIALAVHDEEFQLEGNTVDDPAAAADFDWESFFNASGQESPVLPDVSRPGFEASGFDRDFATNANGTFNTSDGSTFATGSKDTLPITPGWQCGFSSNVNSKTDVTNAYAVSYTDPTGDEILYFGLERNANTGTGNVGFWFLQDEVSCEADANSGNVPFSGDHTDGDILVVSEFSNGGAVATIQAYKWEGGADGALNPDSVADGASCATAAGDDSICASVNTGTITTPWLTANKQDGAGHTLRVSEFFEAGLNLTDENLGGKCFNTFMGVTRSSTSLTATIFDFSLGKLGECITTLTTSAAGTASGNIGAGTVSSGTDTATLSIEGADEWGGTLTWYLCGPVTSDGCDSTGVKVTERTVSNTSLPADFVSGTATLSSAGRYCWTAHFEPDADTAAAGVDPADDNGVGECFNVAAVTPTLPTSATCSATPCVLGSTLTDTATLTGAASQPGSGGPSTAYPTINPATPGAAAGGTITWQLFAGDCTTTRTTTPTSRTVNGNGPYSVTYTTLATDPVGTYTFVANYGGNGPNTNAAATVTCAAPGANETVTVTGSVTSASQQRWLPNDRIVLTTNGPTMTGTLTVTLYPTANCTGTAVPGQSYPFTLSGDASGTVYQTSNTTFFVGTNPNGTAGGSATSYSWKVHVDTQLDDPADRCESTLITITD